MQNRIPIQTRWDKFWQLTLAALVAASLFAVSTQASVLLQTPSSPQYTIQFKDGSYNVVIKNPPFTPYVDSKGNTVDLCYLIRFKDHFDTWRSDALNSSQGSAYVAKYNASYTEVPFSMGGSGFTLDSLGYRWFPSDGVLWIFKNNLCVRWTHSPLKPIHHICFLRRKLLEWHKNRLRKRGRNSPRRFWWCSLHLQLHSSIFYCYSCCRSVDYPC